MDIDLSQYSFDSVAINVVVAWLIQRVKMSKLPVFSWISEETPRVTVLVSVVMAAISAAGMSVDWAAQTSTLTISGLTPGNVGLFVWYVIKNVAFQHAAYRVAFKPSN